MQSQGAGPLCIGSSALTRIERTAYITCVTYAVVCLPAGLEDAQLTLREHTPKL